MSIPAMGDGRWAMGDGRMGQGPKHRLRMTSLFTPTAHRPPPSAGLKAALSRTDGVAIPATNVARNGGHFLPRRRQTQRYVRVSTALGCLSPRGFTDVQEHEHP